MANTGTITSGHAIFFREERALFARELENVPFLRVIPSAANYFLCELSGGITSYDLALRLLTDHNILIKDCSRKKGFPSDRQYVRIAIRNRADNRCPHGSSHQNSRKFKPLKYMKIITDKDIRALNISPARCVDWVRESFLMKDRSTLPQRSPSIPEDDFINTMPCLLPEGIWHVRMQDRITHPRFRTFAQKQDADGGLHHWR